VGGLHLVDAKPTTKEKGTGVIHQSLLRPGATRPAPEITLRVLAASML